MTKCNGGFPLFSKDFLPAELFELFKRHETTLDIILNTSILNGCKEIKSRWMLGAASFCSILQTIFECIQDFQGADIF